MRAVVADPERVFISAGAAHGMEILWHTLRERGARRVGVEDPAWRAIPETIVQAGLEAVPIAVDEHGLNAAELDRIDVDAVVLAPAHQYPTGTVLAPERRTEVIGWARRNGRLVVEDDYDAEYRYGREPIASLQGLAPDCVAYVGTASKTLAPGVRLGWVLVPTHLVGEMAAQHGVARAVPSAITQAAYATLLERGEIDRHLRRTRRKYHARRTALIEALERLLPEASVGGAAAGLHLIAWLPEATDETAISDAAATRRGDPHAPPVLCRDGATSPRAAARVRADCRNGDPARRPGAGHRGRPLAPARISPVAGASIRVARHWSMHWAVRWSSSSDGSDRTLAIRTAAGAGGSSSWKAD